MTSVKTRKLDWLLAKNGPDVIYQAKADEFRMEGVSDAISDFGVSVLVEDHFEFQVAPGETSGVGLPAKDVNIVVKALGEIGDDQIAKGVLKFFSPKMG